MGIFLAKMHECPEEIYGVSGSGIMMVFVVLLLSA